MPKVTIVKPKRKAPKDHSKVTPLHKPGSKPKVAKAFVKKAVKPK